MSTFKPSRVLVVGAGVNGSLCAAALARAGIDVALLARGARADQLERTGIVIEDPFSGLRTMTPIRVLKRLDPLDVYEYVLVAVRENQIAPLLPVLAANRSPNVVFMGNNLAGPGPMVAALGRQRVLMGSVFGGGKKDGLVIRAFTARRISSPFGELDGTVTPRLRRLIQLFASAGLRAKTCADIVDRQATHAIGVALVAAIALRHDVDLKQTAADRPALKSMIDARRQAFHALRSLGRRVVPLSEVLVTALPRALQVAAYRRLLRSRLGEIGLAWHVSQAPDEMRALAEELEAMIAEANVPAPAVDRVLHGAAPV